MKRRRMSPFSLSFIDAVLCGFGAVVLLFLVLSADSLAQRKALTQDLRAQVARLQDQTLAKRKDRLVLRNALAETQVERERFEGLARRIIKNIEDKKVQLARLEKENLATQAHINRLKSDLRSKEEGVKRLEAGATQAQDEGKRLRSFRGHGDRQYLTDFKLGGKRILILVDASASMLGETVVDVVRRRNLPDTQKAKAQKWRRAVASVDWLSTQLPMASKFQIYTFNEQATPVVTGTAGRWLDAGDPAQLNDAVEGLRRVVPQKGTSLHRAFSVARGIQPRPDNIILLTDGLPTQGRTRGSAPTVTGAKRSKHFSEALKVLPSATPVNIILFPMEGDPGAASAFWKLAQTSRGAFFSPSKDWP